MDLITLTILGEEHQSWTASAPVTSVLYGLMLRQIADGGVGLWIWWAPVSSHTEQPKRRPPSWWLGEELHKRTRDEMLHTAAVFSISVWYFAVFVEVFKILADTFSKSVIWKRLSIYSRGRQSFRSVVPK